MGLQLRTHPALRALVDYARESLGLRLLVPDTTYRLMTQHTLRCGSTWTAAAAAAVLLRAMREHIVAGVQEGRCDVVLGPDALAEWLDWRGR